MMAEPNMIVKIDNESIGAIKAGLYVISIQLIIIICWLSVIASKL